MAAKYCKSCSEKFFNKDSQDFAGLLNNTDVKLGFFSPVVLCETCGTIQVNVQGDCISPDCMGEHRTGQHHVVDPQADDDVRQTMLDNPNITIQEPVKKPTLRFSTDSKENAIGEIKQEPSL